MKKQFTKDEFIQGTVEGLIRLGFYGATILAGKIILDKKMNADLETNSKLRNREYENNKLKLRDLKRNIDEIKNDL